MEPYIGEVPRSYLTPARMDIGKVQPCVELNFQCMESAFTESCEVICNEASNSDPLCNLSVKIGADIDVEGDEESRPVAFHKAQTKVREC